MENKKEIVKFPFFSNNKGFTLIEVIVVLLIIGILSAFVLMRNSGQSIGSVENIIQIEKLKSHLRYSQMRALNSNLNWGIQFLDSTYKLYMYDTSQHDYRFPGEDAVALPKPDSISYTGYISFDSWGVPYSISHKSEANPQANRIISTTGNIGDIFIEPYTGYIE